MIFIGKSISIMVGKGSLRHNNRDFYAENVDKSRSWQNIIYNREKIEDVYHKLFDDAVLKYNDKQTRNDRKIENYYDKICHSKQEKPFYEIIVQIGNQDDTGIDSPDCDIAISILEKFYYGFVERNKNLYVFNAVMHLDEATPHLHLDFVPFTTHSSRGLETRVSLKKALENMGFRGKGRSETEWAVWTNEEKNELSQIMNEYGILWDHLDNHTEHLSVLDYKKQKRAEEVIALENEKSELESRTQFLSEVKKCSDYFDDEMEDYKKNYETIELPEPTTFMTARAYKNIIEPLFEKIKYALKDMIETLYSMRRKVVDVLYENRTINRKLHTAEKDVLSLKNENTGLKTELQNYHLLKKFLGYDRLAELIEEAKKPKEIIRISNPSHRHSRDDWER